MRMKSTFTGRCRRGRTSRVIRITTLSGSGRHLPPYLNAVKLPMIHVAGWWDQEDFYGPQKIYELMERHDAEGRNYFVAGTLEPRRVEREREEAGGDRFRQRYGGVLPGEDF